MAGHVRWLARHRHSWLDVWANAAGYGQPAVHMRLRSAGIAAHVLAWRAWHGLEPGRSHGAMHARGRVHHARVRRVPRHSRHGWPRNPRHGCRSWQVRCTPHGQHGRARAATGHVRGRWELGRHAPRAGHSLRLHVRVHGHAWVLHHDRRVCSSPGSAGVHDAGHGSHGVLRRDGHGQVAGEAPGAWAAHGHVRRRV